MITRITFRPDEAEALGLRTTELHDLGPLVVFCGPNGHGKSRHLQMVQNTLHRATHVQTTLETERRGTGRRSSGSAPQTDRAAARETELAGIAIDSSSPPSFDAVMLHYRPDQSPANIGDMPASELVAHVERIASGDYMATNTGMHAFPE